MIPLLISQTTLRANFSPSRNVCLAPSFSSPPCAKLIVGVHEKKKKSRAPLTSGRLVKPLIDPDARAKLKRETRSALFLELLFMYAEGVEFFSLYAGVRWKLFSALIRVWLGAEAVKYALWIFVRLWRCVVGGWKFSRGILAGFTIIRGIYSVEADLMLGMWIVLSLFVTVVDQRWQTNLVSIIYEQQISVLRMNSNCIVYFSSVTSKLFRKLKKKEFMSFTICFFFVVANSAWI